MNDQAVTGNGPHQVVELPLDSREIREDIRVVELEIVQHRDVRRVVEQVEFNGYTAGIASLEVEGAATVAAEGASISA